MKQQKKKQARLRREAMDPESCSFDMAYIIAFAALRCCHRETLRGQALVSHGAHVVTHKVTHMVIAMVRVRVMLMGAGTGLQCTPRSPQAFPP